MMYVQSIKINLILTFFIEETRCIFSRGDIIGEKEIFVGNTDSPAECEDLVRKTIPTATGIKWGDPILMSSNNYMNRNPNDYIDGFSAQRRCYAEFGTEVEASSSWRICFFERK